MIRRAIKIVIGAAVATVFVVGISTFATPAPAASGNCLCPDIYAPVRCSNGIVYSNGCVAGCAHAKNCVRIGDI